MPGFSRVLLVLILLTGALSPAVWADLGDCDLNKDLVVDEADLGLLAAGWLDAGPSPADLDDQTGVTAVDLALFAEHWRGVLGPLTLAINEVMAGNSATVTDEHGDWDDWIEIHNSGPYAIDVGGMYLTDDLSEPGKWRIPSNAPERTMIPGGGFLVIWADDESSQGPLHAGFRLARGGEQVGLYDRRLRLLDGVTFGPQTTDVSYGRYPDTTGSWQSLETASPGRSNASDSGGVSISEIMYHPYHAETAPENLGQEYIELYNAGAGTVNLAGWRLSDGVEYVFANVAIGPGEYLVVAADANAFGEKYPDVNNVVAGWTGRLSNSGEWIELTDPMGVVIDSVRYADEGDWAVRELDALDRGHRGWRWSDAHDGGNRSLELISTGMPNDYGQNWRASDVDDGTPGRVNSVWAAEIAPLIPEVRHTPIIPGPNDMVAVTARVLDENASGVSVRLHYRADASSYDDQDVYPVYEPNSFTVLTMLDDGLHGDGGAGDGVFGAVIEAHPDGTVVEFFVEASDAGGKSRTWPAAAMVDGQAHQVVNALYQVNAAFDPHTAWSAGAQPVYYLIMTEAERARLADIHNGTGGPGDEDDSDSNAHMNGTFISTDGTEVQCRYAVGLRNRGRGSRDNAGGSHANNYRVNFAHDNPWEGVTSLNVNNRYSYLQLLGSTIWRMANLPAAAATAVQVRVNGENLALDNRRMYGSYVAMEVLDSDFADRQFPDDGDGNAYKCTNNTASLGYWGDDPDDYRSAYGKQTNVAQNDYSDIIGLTDALNNTPPDEYLEEVAKVVHIDKWLRYIAVDSLVGNLEGGLNTPRGDDYALYRGIDDPRFWLIPHDMDTLFGLGDQAPDIGRDIHTYAGLDGLQEFLTHPVIARMYHRQLMELIETVFSPEQFEPLVEQRLRDWAPRHTVEAIKDFVRNRNAQVLAQIPRDVTVATGLAINGGYPYTTSDSLTLSGTADAAQTHAVLVQGLEATWEPIEAMWNLGGLHGEPELLVAPGSTWLYHDDGNDLGTSWREVDFNDLLWSTGAAQLGYGDNDEDTVVDGGPSGQRYITTYFRHHFTVETPSEYEFLYVRLLRDDGAIVYLNGDEIARSNMPEGDVDYQTRALSNVSGSEEDEFREYTAPVNALRAGENVLGVEIHQASAGSADISFDMSLDAVRPASGEPLLRPGVNRILVQGLDDSGSELQRGFADIWYDTGSTADYSDQSGEPDPGEPPQPPHLVMTVRDSYLPTVPILVRAALRDNEGHIDRQNWDAAATLSVMDNPSIVLSADQVLLFNGQGSALVTCSGSGDFTLVATLGTEQVGKTLRDLSNEPLQVVSGGISQSQTWDGVYSITGGDFSIDAGATLTLNPGTLVLIDGAASGSDGTDVDVAGSIRSLGTVQSPVTFSAYTAGANWGELHFSNADPSTFTYTNITQAGHSPRTGHSNSGPAIRASGSTIVFDGTCLTDNAGKIMHATSGCDFTFRDCVFARSVMGPEVSGTALRCEDLWIVQMHADDDADGIYIHGQQSGQICSIKGGVMADMHDDAVDTLGSDVTVEDVIIRDCRDKGVSVYGGETTLRKCLIVGNNQSPEDPTVATVAAKTTEGNTAVVNIDQTTIVTTKTPGVTDIGIQSHNKYGVTSGTIVYNVTNSIIDATDPVDTQAPYVESDIHIDYSNVFDEEWPGVGNLNSDPLFADPAGHDYRLLTGSPCIGTAGNGGDRGYYQTHILAVGGSITEDTTWTAAHGPYRVVGDLTVPEGITLTILQGASVFFEPATKMTIRGRLVAQGHPYAMIRFTRTPGRQSTWRGLQFVDSMADNVIAYAVIEHAQTNNGMIGLSNSRLELVGAHLENTDRRRIRTVNSSLVVRRCVFADMFGPNEPPSTDNLSEHIWGSGIAEGGLLLIEGNVFGTTPGHNDAIDFDTATRPGPIPQILNNVFMGGGDDALDLEADAHIEGNVFMNYRKDQYNTTPRESNVFSAGNGKDYVVVRNVFRNVDHVAQVKDDAFMIFSNNTVADARVSAFYFEIPGQTTSPGHGVHIDSSIFADTPVLLERFYVDDPNWGTTDIRLDRCLVASDWHVLGEGNIDADPLFVDGDSGDFRLQPISPAIGAGLNGLDMGAFVPAGASIAGEPSERTWRTEALLTMGGPGIVTYSYSVNNPDGPWSQDRSVDDPVELTGLVDGQSYRVYVLGRDSAGVRQGAPTASRTWTVDSAFRRLQINEILAANRTTLEYDGMLPDLIELYYDGPVALDLGGMSLSDDPDRPRRFVFPSGTVIEPQGMLVIPANGNLLNSVLHTTFALDDEGDALYLYDSDGTLLDAVEFGRQLPDLSIGRVGCDGQWRLNKPTFGQANVAYPQGDPRQVRINEWLARGEAPFGDDFIELYNGHVFPVGVGGFYLTDNPVTQMDKCQFRPLTFIDGEGFLTLIADDQDRFCHTNFKLSSGGEMIGLFDPTLRRIDQVIYGPATTNVSEGRTPDGSSRIGYLSEPTPGEPNPVDDTVVESIVLVPIDHEWAYEQSGAAMPATWIEPAFDDASWPVGAALLYVEGSALPAPKNTELVRSPELITYYFRSHFQFDGDPNDVTRLEFSTVIDDGAVFYLNARELRRLGMDEGDFDYDTLANRSVGNATYEGPFEIPVEYLLTGDNVLAAEVHQTSATSSDIVFGLEVHAEITYQAPHE